MSYEIAKGLLTGEYAIGFSQLSKTWYYSPNQNGTVEEMSIGVYCVNGGTMGEFNLEWAALANGAAAQLRAYHDAWQVFPFMPKLFPMLASVSTGSNNASVSPDIFANMLEKIGFLNLTAITKGVNYNIIQKRTFGLVPPHMRQFIQPFWTHYASADRLDEKWLRNLSHPYEVDGELLLLTNEEDAVLAGMTFCG